MTPIETIIILMSILIGLNYIATRLKISYPILLVIAGLAISIIPGIPSIKLSPNLVFLIFLPPLLFEAAFGISWHDFKKFKTPIFGLAIGLVFLTTLAVAICIHYLTPGFSWPLAFLLGAIVSPPDAIAATSATKGIRLPKMITAILEGESLVNDASALIAYRYAIAATLSGTFSLFHASMQFVTVSLGGIVIGLIAGIVINWIHKKIDEPNIEVSITLVAPYISYLIAEHLKTSGVLAVVSTGLYIAWHSSESFSFESRMKAFSFWEIFTFLLNGFVFILIGLQLPEIIHHHGSQTITNLVIIGLLISLTVILIRVIWIFPISKLLYSLRGKSSQQNGIKKPNAKYLMIGSWAGMRGVVSLASALAVPMTLNDGSDFPMRNEILFITFIVILVTLVIQGLTLPSLVKKLKVEEPIEKTNEEDKEIRSILLRDSLKYIEGTLVSELAPVVIQEIIQQYKYRLDYINSDKNEKSHQENLNTVEKTIQNIKSELKVIEHQRKIVIQMHKNGTFSTSLLRQVEQDLDAWNLSNHTRLRIAKTHNKI